MVRNIFFKCCNHFLFIYFLLRPSFQRSVEFSVPCIWLAALLTLFMFPCCTCVALIQDTKACWWQLYTNKSWQTDATIWSWYSLYVLLIAAIFKIQALAFFPVYISIRILFWFNIALIGNYLNINKKGDNDINMFHGAKERIPSFWLTCHRCLHEHLPYLHKCSS